MERDNTTLSLVMFAIWSGPVNVATHIHTALCTNEPLDSVRFIASLISLVSAAFAMTVELYTSRKYLYYAILSLPFLLISWMLVTELQ